MAFRNTCAWCKRTHWVADNRLMHRGHVTCGPICRLAQRMERQRIRRRAKRKTRLASTALGEVLNVWHRPRRKGKWKGSPSLRSKQSLMASGHGPLTISKAKGSARKTSSRARSKPSRK